MNEFVVFDVETQNSFDDVGGFRNVAKLGISVAVTYDSRSDSTRAYREPELDALVAHLQDAPLVVGFNILRFDYHVLQPYTEVNLQALPSLDMLARLHRSLGHRVSLDNLARGTLNIQKSGHGLEAIAWYRQGEWEKLIRYCTDDVLITRDVYLFGRQNGFVKFWDKYRRGVRQVAVNW